MSVFYLTKLRFLVIFLSIFKITIMPRRKNLSEGDVTVEDLDDIHGFTDSVGDSDPDADYDTLLDDINTPDEDELAEIDDVRNGIRRDFRKPTEDSVFIVIQQEDKIARKRISDLKRKKKDSMLVLKEKLKQENVFRNLNKAKRAEKIKEICSLKLNSDKIDILFSHSRKLQKFILEAVAKANVNWDNLQKDDKIQLLKEHGVKNSAWIAYLTEAVRICFPRIDFYSTGCNPVEFISIVFEEVLAPLTNLRASAQINTWYSNYGDKLEQKMREKMTELLKTRLK